MYRRSVTAGWARWASFFAGLLLFLFYAYGFFSFLEDLSYRDFAFWGDIVMMALGLFVVGNAFYQSRHAIIVDEKGVRANIGKHRGDIPWDKVSEIGILRTPGGDRIVYVAGPAPRATSAALAFHRPSDDLIKAGYDKKLIAAIEEHYPGPILGHTQTPAR